MSFGFFGWIGYGDGERDGIGRGAMDAGRFEDHSRRLLLSGSRQVGQSRGVHGPGEGWVGAEVNRGVLVGGSPHAGDEAEPCRGPGTRFGEPRTSSLGPPPCRESGPTIGRTPVLGSIRRSAQRERGMGSS